MKKILLFAIICTTGMAMEMEKLQMTSPPPDLRKNREISKIPQRAYFRTKCPKCSKKFRCTERCKIVKSLSGHIKLCKSNKSNHTPRIKEPSVQFDFLIRCPFCNYKSKKCGYFGIKHNFPQYLTQHIQTSHPEKLVPKDPWEHISFKQHTTNTSQNGFINTPPIKIKQDKPAQAEFIWKSYCPLCARFELLSSKDKAYELLKVHGMAKHSLEFTHNQIVEHISEAQPRWN